MDPSFPLDKQRRESVTLPLQITTRRSQVERPLDQSGGLGDLSGTRRTRRRSTNSLHSTRTRTSWPRRSRRPLPSLKALGRFTAVPATRGSTLSTSARRGRRLRRSKNRRTAKRKSPSRRRPSKKTRRVNGKAKRSNRKYRKKKNARLPLARKRNRKDRKARPARNGARLINQT